MTNRILVEVKLTLGSVGSRIHPVISPVPECIIELEILTSRQYSPIDSRACRVTAIMLGKAKWKPLDCQWQRKL